MSEIECSCANAGFPGSCYNCDAEAADIVNAIRKLYSTHPICMQAANFIERHSARSRVHPGEPQARAEALQALADIDRDLIGHDETMANLDALKVRR